MTYGEFWLRYLRAHAKPATRALHYCGSTLALGSIALAILAHNYGWLVFAPVAGYSFAWGAHFFVEHNRPETFGHPFWSLISDFRMFFLFISGRLQPHFRTCGL
ncbi:MAG: hypothetical protein B7Z81_05565 [Acidocella sp. 20-61-6]|nr:MAG: hypothetical protein B7Z81_05565 [Acidocella sp. 20-61-6]